MNNFNLAKLTDKYKVIFLGDDHNMRQGRYWLAEQIKKGNLNIDFLALEYVEALRQDLLEKGDQEEVEKYLKNAYKEFPGLSADSILDVINSCKAAKIKVFGIEMPDNSFDDWKSENAQKERTEYIAKGIIKLTKFGRGLVLIGADHAEKKGKNVFNIVKEFVGSENVVSIVLIGGKNWSLDTGDYWIRKLELEAKKQKKNKEFYSYAVNNNLLPADWIIHFPQTEELKKSRAFNNS